MSDFLKLLKFKSFSLVKGPVSVFCPLWNKERRLELMFLLETTVYWDLKVD